MGGKFTYFYRIQLDRTEDFVSKQKTQIIGYQQQNVAARKTLTIQSQDIRLDD